MNIRQNIPNFITLGNLLFGCIAISFLTTHHLSLAALCVLFAAVLDFFDGFVARWLQVVSPLGKQLDSLADVVSFGLVPALGWYIWIGQLMVNTEKTGIYTLLTFVPFSMVLAGAWRLARFNIDTEKTDYFKGLPIPATGLFWAGITLSPEMVSAINDETLLMGIALVSLALSALMVSRLPLLNLKFSNYTFKENKSRYMLIFLSVFITLCCGIFAHNLYMAIPLIILSYFILSRIHFYILSH